LFDEISALSASSSHRDMFFFSTSSFGTIERIERIERKKIRVIRAICVQKKSSAAACGVSAIPSLEG
jgi:hypothetical protein